MEQITEVLGFVDEDVDETHVGTLDGKPVVEYQQSHQNRFNRTRFDADHPDLVEQYKERKKVRSLRVVGLK